MFNQHVLHLLTKYQIIIGCTHFNGRISTTLYKSPYFIAILAIHFNGNEKHIYIMMKCIEIELLFGIILATQQQNYQNEQIQNEIYFGFVHIVDASGL